MLLSEKFMFFNFKFKKQQFHILTYLKHLGKNSGYRKTSNRAPPLDKKNIKGDQGENF
jgi:hypothetical protein